jgi:gliding motility-associated-like protein
MKYSMFLFRLLPASLLFLSQLHTAVQAQTGNIFQNSTGVGSATILDPGNDDYITSTGTTFTSTIEDESDEFDAVFHEIWCYENEPTGDLQTGPNCGSTEIVDNPNTGKHAAYYRFIDPDNILDNGDELLVFRIRIGSNPGNAGFGYSILLDTDLGFGNTGPSADVNYMSGNPGFEFEVLFGSGNNNGVEVNDVDGVAAANQVTNLASYATTQRHQRSYALLSNCGGTPVFMDFYIDFSDLGISATTPLRMAFATSSSPNSALGGSASDIGGVDDDNYASDDAAFVNIINNSPVMSFSGGYECVATYGISNDTSICDGDNIGLVVNLVSPSAGVTYAWSTGDTTSSISVNPAASTSYYVSITDTVGTCEDSVQVTINNGAPCVITSCATTSDTCVAGDTTIYMYEYTLLTEGFEVDSDGWTLNGTVTPAPRYEGGPVLGSNYFLGRFSSNETVQKTFDLGQKSHRIAFDIYRLDSWDNESLKVFVGDGTLLLINEAFTFNSSSAQLYSGSASGYSYTMSSSPLMDIPYLNDPSQSNWYDQIIRVYIDVPSGLSSLTLKVGSTLSQAANDESFGLDNFSITCTQFDVPAGVDNVDVFVVGGGGGGGGDGGPGGGGGEIRYGQIDVSSISTLTARPSRGGRGDGWNVGVDNQGDASEIYNGATLLYKANGGQGGGGASTSTTNAGGIGGFGGTGLQGASGGIGINGSCSIGGVGGTGSLSEIKCVNTRYAGGGGGGIGVNTNNAAPFLGPAGGLGGGGRGANYRLAFDGSTLITGSTNGANGIDGTGGGGGGGSACNAGTINTVNQRTTGGYGGSGSIIIRYAEVALGVSVSESSLPSCNGLSDGEIVATAAGGVTNYNFYWSNNDSTLNTSSTTDTLTGLTAGIYTVTVVDANGDSALASFTLTEPAALAVTAMVTSQETCVDANDGSVSLTVSGGTADSTKTFAFDEGAIPANINTYGNASFVSTGGVTGGRMRLVPNSSSAQGSFYIDSLVSTENHLNIGFDFKMASDGDGFHMALTDLANAQASPNQGEENIATNSTSTGFELAFEDIVTDRAYLAYNNVILGTHTFGSEVLNGPWHHVDVYLNNGLCTVVFNSTDTLFNGVTLTGFTPQNAFLKFAARNGAAASEQSIDNLTIGKPLLYNWSNGSVAQNLTGLAPGAYSVTVTDANGCTDSTSVNIIEYVAPTVLALDTVTTCAADSITLTANGTGTYLWSNGATTAFIDVLASGIYSVTLTDTNSCQTVDSIAVSILNTANGTQDLTLCLGEEVEISAPKFKPSGLSPATALRSLNDANGLPSGVYWYIVGTDTFQVQVDGETDGGGWVLALNYVHQGGTNPALNVFTDKLPLIGSSTLGTNESTSPIFWGHAGNVLMDSLNPEEIRFYGVSSGHNRVLNFKTSLAGALSYVQTGLGSMTGLNNAANYTLLDGHTGFLPAQSDQFYTNEGDFALSNFPYYKGGTYHWGVRGQGTRWEVDDYPNNASVNTIHRVWVRGGDINAGGLPATYVWSTGDTTTSISVSPNTTTQYTVTFTDGIGTCIDTVEVTVSNPTLSLGFDTTATYTQDSIVLDAGAGWSTYSWSSGDTTQTANITASQEVIVSVGDSVGCEVSDTVVVSIINISNATGDTAICVGDSVELKTALNTGLDLTGLAAYYNFENGATDLSPNANNLTVLGPTLVNDVYGDAYSFDGNDRLNLPAQTGLPLGNSHYTITAYIKPSAMGSRGIIGWGSWGQTNRVNAMRLYNNGLINYWWSNDISASTANLTGQWHKVAATFDGTTRRLFLNGVQVAQDTPVGKNTTFNDFNIGRTNGGEWFLGLIDNVSIWTRALSIDEINAVDGTVSEVNYTFLWSTGDTTANITVAPTTPTTYTVTVSDGYTSTVDTIVIGTSQPTLSAGVTPTDCEGTQNGTITTTVTGGTLPYQYSWNNAATSANLSGLGVGTYTVTVTDSVGCSVDSAFVISGVDTIAPTALAGETFLYLDANGEAVLTFLAADSGSADNCGIDSTWISVTQFDCDDIGVSTMQLSVFDTAGNGDTTSFTLHVLDTITPSVIGQNLTVYLDASGNVSITAAQVDNGTSDNCGIDTIYLSDYDFDCNDVGVNSVTFTAEDDNGNTKSETFSITVVDSISPVVLAQNLTVYLDASGSAVITPAQINNGSSDNCTIASYGLSTSSFNCADTGVNAVQLTVTDVNGNSSTASVTVTVLDTIAPSLVAQNVTVYLDGNGDANITTGLIDNGTADNCSIAQLTLSNSSFDCQDVGVNNIIFTAVDVNGNSSSANVVVTVLDTIAPSVIGQNLTLYLDASGNVSITAAQVDNGTSDNCGIDTIYLSDYDFDCNDVGVNSVTFTAEDDNGNTKSETFSITVVDSISPVVLAQNLTVYLDASGSAVITPAQINNGSSDNCTIASYGLSTSSFNCADTGVNAVQLTVTDVNGNSSTASVTVTVLDTIAPSLVAQNVTVYLDGNGDANITTGLIDNGTADNCSIAQLTLSNSSFDCQDVGVNNIIFTAVDVNGNSSSANVVVTVLDTIAPSVIGQNLTVYLDASGDASITTAQVNNGASDNCGIDTLYLSQYDFDCNDVGANAITLTAEDVNGNLNTSSVTVTVLDTIAPSVAGQNFSVWLDANGQASITSGEVNNGSNDNCGINTFSLSTSTFNCGDTGTNTVLLTVTDLSGNSASATVTIDVLDTTAPSLAVQNLSIYLDANGLASITTGMVDVGTTDNCGIDQLSLSATDFDCNDVGVNNVVFTAVDVNGNTNTANVVVTVLDTISPTAIAQNLTLYLDASGAATIAPAAVNNGSFDNCGISTLSLSQSVFGCEDVGNNVVVFTVTDDNGNTDDVTVNVDVLDTILPSVLTQNITVYLDSAGQVSILPIDIDDASFDNCAIDSMLVQPNAFNCGDTGLNTVVLTIWDEHGNSDSASAVVTVVDTVAPFVVTNNVLLTLDSNGQGTITVQDVDSIMSDACGIASTSLNLDSFNCSNIGSNTVLLTVTDVNGNSTIASAIVTVIDTVDPTALAQNLVIYLDATGSASVTPSMADSASIDNCAIDTMYVSKSDFNCGDAGSNDVTLFVLDGSGNLDSANFNVTVIDTVLPSIQIEDIIIALDSNGFASISVLDVDSGSVDNCAIDTLYLNQYDFECIELGVNDVLFYAQDVFGNLDSMSFTVTVIDTIAPVISTRDTLIYLDADGSVALDPDWFDDGTTDNCTIDSIYLSQANMACENAGSNTITFYAVDQSGNVDSQRVEVVIIDTIAPSITCPVSFETCDTIVDFEAPVVFDACGIESLIQVGGLTSGSFFPEGITEITYELVDLNGNNSSCSFSIERYAIPMIQAPADTTVYYAEPVVLEPLDSLVVQYSWSPSIYLEGQATKTPTAKPLEDITYTVVGTSVNGCSASDEVSISVLNEIRFAQAFSPNGDGVNDVFHIEGIDLYPECKVTIVNRYGLRVFESIGYDEPWDGTFRAADLPVGSYFFVIMLDDGGAEISGTITIIR